MTPQLNTPFTAKRGKLLNYALLFVILMTVLPAQSEESQLYRDFLNTPEGEGALLPDFSYAGYHLCEVPVPTVSRDSHRYFDVTDYGALPNDGHSDEEAILTANAAAHAYDGPAVLYFPRGKFLWGKPGQFFASQIKITRNDYVVKGAGSEVGGTLIEQMSLFTHAKGRLNPDNKGYCFDIGPEVETGKLGAYRAKHRTPVTKTADRGLLNVTVEDAAWIKAGMVVKLDAYIANNYQGAQAYYEPSQLTEGYFNRILKDRDYRRGVYELHKVSRVEKNKITFADPILLDLDKGIEGVYVAPAIFADQTFVEEVGIEDIAFSGGFKELFFHYFGENSTTAHMGIRFFNAINCWARNICIINCNVGMRWDSSLYSTISNVDFTGCGGHFAITCTSGSNGLLFSYLRELSCNHHGFGATSATKNIIYHRSQQIGNLEGHAGYPQGTLFDRNDGLFGLFRTGGRSPHHGRYLTYWNWNNTRFDEQPYLEANVKGDSPKQQLDSIVFDDGEGDPSNFPPIIVGLHGDPISVEGSVMAQEAKGKQVEPDSLFEAQLSERLGRLPQDIEKQSQEFEAIKRYARIDIASPKNDSAHPIGRQIAFVPRYPARFNQDHIRKVELYLSRTTDELGQPVAATSDKDNPLNWYASQSGIHVARLCLTDTLGDTTLSRPIYFFVQGRHDAMTPVTPKQGWLLQDLIGPFRGVESKAKNQYLRSYRHEDYVALFANHWEDMKKRFQEDNDSVQAVPELIDNDDNTGMTIENDIYYSPRNLVFDLGEATNICRVDIVRGRPTTPMEQISMDIKTSNDPNAIYAYTNGLRLWKDGLRVVGATLQHNFVEAQSNGMLTYYFPETKAQFVQLFFNVLNPKDIKEVIFYQHQEYTSNEAELRFELQ